MKLGRFCGAFGALLLTWTLPALAQVNLQKFQLEDLYFQFTPRQVSAQRCLTWQPLKDTQPTIEFDDKEEPFVRVKLIAQIKGDCTYTLKPEGVIRERARRAGLVAFEMIVRPPATTAYLKGPDFEDELIVEAPLKKLGDIEFFDFFRRAKIQFESRTANLSTTNGAATEKNVSIFPVFGGHISVPAPWFPFLRAGFGMHQNLGNFYSGGSSPVQISEIGFDLAILVRGPERYGRPEAALVGEIHTHNIYQTNATSDSALRPFVMGSTLTPGGGLDLSWYFGGALAPWKSWISRLGVDLSGRYYGGFQIAGRPFSAFFLDGTLNYRITKKYALGLGYSLLHKNMSNLINIPTGSVTESVSSFFLRVSIIPPTGDEGRR